MRQHFLNRPTIGQKATDQAMICAYTDHIREPLVRALVWKRLMWDAQARAMSYGPSNDPLIKSMRDDALGWVAFYRREWRNIITSEWLHRLADRS